MKRFWLVLQSLGLIVAFSTSAMAVDLKFSGEYYAAGVYLDKTDLATGIDNLGVNHDAVSTAFYYQRLRVKTDLVVTPGLTLITRFNAMERAWGATRSVPGTTLAVDSAGTVAENENIAFDWVYVNYKSPAGVFDVGYMNYGSTGTIFGNNSAPQGRIKYSYTYGPATINAVISKVKDNSYRANNIVAFSDTDNDVYHLEGVYQWKNGLAGLNVNYYRSAATRPPNILIPANGNYLATYLLFTPYAIAKIGPVALQAELNYANGKAKTYDYGSGQDDVKLENWSGWIDATADFKMAYFGGTIAYVSGDNPSTKDKQEGGTINGGRDWSPCLILFNYYDRAQWIGNLNGNNGAADNGVMSNAWFFQGRAGVKPMDKLDIMVSVSYANTDRRPTGNWKKTDYGWEVDLTGTYKITNNLSYMLGAGYLFTGGYFKGEDDNNQIQNDFLVVNKLTLTF